MKNDSSIIRRCFMLLHYDARVRVLIGAALVAACLLPPAPLRSSPNFAAQDAPESPKSENLYQDTFSGPIIELTADKITVSRSVLGKPAEKRTFLIKSETKIEGKLKVKVRVTIGYVKTEDGDVATLIVVRPQKK